MIRSKWQIMESHGLSGKFEKISVHSDYHEYSEADRGEGER